jgi:hypothetical protein
MGKKRKNLPGTVDKIIKPVVPSEPEKAQIDIEGADDLYREIRIENTLTDEHGEEVRLKQGVQVDVSIEADTDATLKKPKAPTVFCASQLPTQNRTAARLSPKTPRKIRDTHLVKNPRPTFAKSVANLP